MRYDIAPVEELIEVFRRFPGVGGKSARRMAYYLLSRPKEESLEAARKITNAVTVVRHCSVCCNLSGAEICPVCSDDSRDKSIICVVQGPQDMLAVERTGEFNGMYHILNGVLSPQTGVKPSDLTAAQLLNRLDDGVVKEVILATSTTAEGEVTAVYLTNLIKQKSVRVTRLAYGIPVGGDLEFADEMTIQKALSGRSER